jgi:hypothetical protein
MNETAEKSLETRFMEIEVVCRRCQSKWQPPIAKFVNVKTDPDARLGILLKTMHNSYCPHCKTPREIETTFEYYDPDQGLLVQIRPEWEFKAGGGEDWYLKRFEDLVHKYSDTDIRVDVVFGFQEMIDKYLGGEQGVVEAKAEWEQRRAAAIARFEERSKQQQAFYEEEPEDEEGESEESGRAPA